MPVVRTSEAEPSGVPGDEFEVLVARTSYAVQRFVLGVAQSPVEAALSVALEHFGPAVDGTRDEVITLRRTGHVVVPVPLRAVGRVVSDVSGR